MPQQIIKTRLPHQTALIRPLALAQITALAINQVIYDLKKETIQVYSQGTPLDIHPYECREDGIVDEISPFAVDAIMTVIGAATNFGFEMSRAGNPDICEYCRNRLKHKGAFQYDDLSNITRMEFVREAGEFGLFVGDQPLQIHPKTKGRVSGFSSNAAHTLIRLACAFINAGFGLTAASAVDSNKTMHIYERDGLSFSLSNSYASKRNLL